MPKGRAIRLSICGFTLACGSLFTTSLTLAQTRVGLGQQLALDKEQRQSQESHPEFRVELSALPRTFPLGGKIPVTLTYRNVGLVPVPLDALRFSSSPQIAVADRPYFQVSRLAGWSYGGPYYEPCLLSTEKNRRNDDWQKSPFTRTLGRKTAFLRKEDAISYTVDLTSYLNFETPGKYEITVSACPFRDASNRPVWVKSPPLYLNLTAPKIR